MPRKIPKYAIQMGHIENLRVNLVKNTPACVAQAGVMIDVI